MNDCIRCTISQIIICFFFTNQNYVHQCPLYGFSLIQPTQNSCFLGMNPYKMTYKNMKLILDILINQTDKNLDRNGELSDESHVKPSA